MVRSCRCYRSRISDRDVSCERSKSRAKRHCALFIELAPTGHRAGHTKLIARQVPRGRSDGLVSSHAVRQSHIHFLLFFPPFERMIMDEPSFRRTIVWLVGSRFAGTLLAQVLLIPAASLIVFVAEKL
jgi:hypothetical protein